MTVFLSDAIHESRRVFDPPGDPGSPRGWTELSALYGASLAACGHPVTRLARPEIYQTDIARAACGVRPGDWHLAVKPIEHLRPFHGLRNVFACDWPFPELSHAPRGGNPFFDHLRMLRLADAVLCPTAFTADTLRRAGLDRVHILPPHIPPPAHSPAPPDRGRFVHVADPRHPHRLAPVVAGFLRACAQRDDLRLLVHGRDGAPEPHPAVTFVPPGRGADWLDGADFLLCADPTPGLPVPLAQAMLAGVPAVAILQAGAGAIVPPGAAVPIATQPMPLPPDDEPIGRWLALTYHPPAPAEICRAVLEAAALEPGARARMAAAARDDAARRFGLPAFRAGLAGLNLAGLNPG